MGSPGDSFCFVTHQKCWTPPAARPDFCWPAGCPQCRTCSCTKSRGWWARRREAWRPARGNWAPCWTETTSAGLYQCWFPGKTKRRFWAKFRIFRSFSTYFLPIVPHLLFLSPHVFGIRLFPPISIYCPLIFCLKWYLILVINSSMEPIFCFSTHMLTDSAYFPLSLLPVFCGPVLPGPIKKNIGQENWLTIWRLTIAQLKS